MIGPPGKSVIFYKKVTEKKFSQGPYLIVIRQTVGHKETLSKVGEPSKHHNRSPLRVLENDHSYQQQEIPKQHQVMPATNELAFIPLKSEEFKSTDPTFAGLISWPPYRNLQHCHFREVFVEIRIRFLWTFSTMLTFRN